MLGYLLFAIALAVAVFAVQAGHGKPQRETLRDRRRRRAKDLDGS